MARSYANITTAIWQNDDFRALPSDAQRLYFMLLTQADISSCGVLPITLKRWAGNASDTDEQRVSKAFRYLIDTHYVVADFDREEALVRTFIKWDGGYKIPKRLTAILKAASTIQSPELMQVVAAELDKLGVAHNLPVRDAQWVSNGYREGTDTPGVVVTTEVSTTQPTTHNPQPATPDESRDSSGSRKRATTIPEDFQPSIKALEWQRTNHPAVDVADETERFINHHRAKGSKFVDLDAAWRNWIKNAVKFAAENPRRLTAVPSGDDRWQTPAADFDERW